MMGPSTLSTVMWSRLSLKPPPPSAMRPNTLATAPRNKNTETKARIPSTIIILANRLMRLPSDGSFDPDFHARPQIRCRTSIQFLQPLDGGAMPDGDVPKGVAGLDHVILPV